MICSKILKALWFLAWFFVALLVDAVLNAWAMSELWDWFVAAQYGSGPQIGAWFGIAVIARLILRNKANEEHIFKPLQVGDDPLGGMVKKTLWSWASVLFVLGIIWCIGSMFHWVR